MSFGFTPSITSSTRPAFGQPSPAFGLPSPAFGQPIQSPDRKTDSSASKESKHQQKLQSDEMEKSVQLICKDVIRHQEDMKSWIERYRSLELEKMEDTQTINQLRDELAQVTRGKDAIIAEYLESPAFAKRLDEEYEKRLSEIFHPSYVKALGTVQNKDPTMFGPVDGVLGSSQGAFVAATLPGMQVQGVALTKVESIKFVMLISGGELGGFKFPAPKLAQNAFSSLIETPSLHCFGENDIARLTAIELLGSFVDPFVIYHSGGHEIPRLDENGLEVMISFLDKIQETYPAPIIRSLM